MKRIILCILMLILFGCVDKGIYTDEEYETLKSYGIEKQAVEECENPETIQVMLKGNFIKENLPSYCKLKVDSDYGVNELINKDLSIEEIEEYLSYSYMRLEKLDRYIQYESDSIQDKILKVNMDLDLKPYEITKIVDNLADYTLLVNKYNALPEGYKPDDLVPMVNACIYGKDYSCSGILKEVRKVAADAWEEFCKAASEQGLELRAVGAFRTYDYQKNLYNYYYNLKGKDYAEKFYARPGQSEHNSGLAIDLTFNDHIYYQIEDKKGYDWIVQNMHKYGFILRYPKDKTDITLYGYESWHLRYVGKEVAQYIYENNLTLEEYKAMQ